MNGQNVNLKNKAVFYIVIIVIESHIINKTNYKYIQLGSIVCAAKTWIHPSELQMFTVVQ